MYFCYDFLNYFVIINSIAAYHTHLTLHDVHQILEKSILKRLS